MAVVKTLVFTTERDHEWLKKHEREILDTLRTAKDVQVEPFVYRYADITKPETYQDADGKIRIKWDWFKNVFTQQAEIGGFNAVCFHFTRDKRTEWKLAPTINGTYQNDPDEVWEFWVCADQGQKSTQRQTDPNISQWVRVFIHELGGHGFIRWFHPERANDVHHYDYDLKSIKSLLPTIDATKWTKMKQIVELLKKLVALLLLKNEHGKHVSRLDDWASAIQEFEGWYDERQRPPAGSRSYRQNNPGNLRWSPFEDGNIDNFSVFNTYEKGREALIHQLRIAANGESRVYKPDMTLYRFFEVYAPSSDNNHPQHYAEFVAKRLGISPTVLIKTLL